MTLEENKKITLALIEEYAPNNQYLTDDEDIRDRLNLVYAPAYQELSQEKKILKTKVLKDIGEEGTGYEEFTLPSNMYQQKRIIAVDEDNNQVEPKYYTLGKKVYIDKASNYKYILEYYIYPTVITEETDGGFSLEIDQDAQMVLPYLVANDILKADPSADYTAYLTEYNRKMNAWDTARSSIAITCEEGVRGI